MPLELARLTLRAPDVTLIDDVTESLTPGVTFLTGANGVGKTTLLRALAGLVPPSAGAVLWGGKPIEANLRTYRRRLGYLPQRQATYPEMTVAGFLDYMSALKAIPPDLAFRRRNDLLEALGISSLARELLARLSQGQRQLVGIGQALLNDPEVLLLDEPLEGLDFDSRDRVLGLIHRPGRTTVIATHRLELAVSGVVALWRLQAGKILADPLIDASPALVLP